MANHKIGEEKVKPTNISLEPKDWDSFKALKTLYNLNSVSSLFRLLLRLWQANHHKDFAALGSELSDAGYQSTLDGLIRKIHNENKKIENKKIGAKDKPPLPPGF